MQTGNRISSTEIRNAAAKLIEEGGLAKGVFHRGGAYCLLGALAQAAQNAKEFGNALSALEQAEQQIRSELGAKAENVKYRRGGFSIRLSEWSDDHTAEEVCAALRGRENA